MNANGAESMSGAPSSNSCAASQPTQNQTFILPRQARWKLVCVLCWLFALLLFFEQWAAACLLSSLKRRRATNESNQSHASTWRRLMDVGWLRLNGAGRPSSFELLWVMGASAPLPQRNSISFFNKELHSILFAFISFIEEKKRVSLSSIKESWMWNWRRMKSWELQWKLITNCPLIWRKNFFNWRASSSPLFIPFNFIKQREITFLFIDSIEFHWRLRWNEMELNKKIL